MTVRGRRFRLGLFVVGSGAMFVALLTFVLDSTLRAEHATYRIMFAENVKGMVVGSRVNFQGVPIGVVCDMRFQDGKTLVTLNVDPSKSTIQRVTRARMDRLLVTGQVTIELEGYSQDSEPLPEGSFIEVKEDPLNSLRATVPELVDEATHVLMRLDDVLQRAEGVLGEDNQGRVATILDNLAVATTALRERTLPAVDALLDEGRGVVADLHELTATGRTSLDEARDLIAAFGRLEPGLTSLVAELRGTAAGVDGLLDSLRVPLQGSLSALRQTLAEVGGLARQLQMAPDSLLFGRKRPAAPFGGER